MTGKEEEGAVREKFSAVNATGIHHIICHPDIKKLTRLSFEEVSFRSG